MLKKKRVKPRCWFGRDLPYRDKNRCHKLVRYEVRCFCVTCRGKNLLWCGCEQHKDQISDGDTIQRKKI